MSTAHHLAYALALVSNLCFAASSLVYADFSKRFSADWMNAVKAIVAWFCLFLILIGTGLNFQGLKPFAALLMSGWVGLCFGDFFLLSAFVHLGSSRTLMIFGFQPFFLGLAAYFLFGQEIEPFRFVSIFFLVGCLFFFSFEKYKKSGHWEVRGLLQALAGVSLDTVGILLTRWAFDEAPGLPLWEGHFYRCTGALAGFAILAFLWRPLSLTARLRELNVKQKALLLAASFFGTFLSLTLYLNALRIGHLASLSSIAVTGPLFASLFELFWKKQRPSIFMLAAMACFILGFTVLVAQP